MTTPHFTILNKTGLISTLHYNSLHHIAFQNITTLHRNLRIVPSSESNRPRQTCDGKITLHNTAKQDCTKLFSTILNCTEQYSTTQNRTEPNTTRPNSTGLNSAILNSSLLGLKPNLSGKSARDKILCKPYSTLQNFSALDYTLTNFTELHPTQQHYF